MKNLIKKIGLASAGIALFALPIMVMGQNVGTTITPLVREINANPGETFTGRVEITNTGESEQVYTPLVRDFRASDNPNSGTPQFTEVSDEQAVSRWTTFASDSLILQAGEKQAIEYTVRVPQNATPGGHYGAIIASAQPGGVEGTGVGIQPEVGSLILVTVSGEQILESRVIDFRPLRKVFSMDPASFVATIRNGGNVHLKPYGSIDITGPANTTINVNSTKASVLPNSTRNFFAEHDGSLPFGKYTAKLELRAEAPDGRTIPISAITTFWVVPMGYIIGLLAFLIFLYIVMRHWTSESHTGKGSKKTASSKK